MVAKISKTLRGQPRRIPVGFGIFFNFKPFNYAQYKEVEAWARRTAQDKLSDEQAAALAGMDAEEMSDEFKDRLIGLSEQLTLDRLVMNFCESWEGVEEYDDDPEKSWPMSFTAENWKIWRDDFPLLAEILEQQLRNPMHVLVAEGNEYAPLQSLSELAG